jgi:hypothetical protein
MSKHDSAADFSDFKHLPEWCIQSSKDIEFINDVSATSLIRKIYGAYLPEDNESRRDGNKKEVSCSMCRCAMCLSDLTVFSLRHCNMA